VDRDIHTLSKQAASAALASQQGSAAEPLPRAIVGETGVACHPLRGALLPCRAS